MRPLGTVLLVLAIPIAGMAVLIGGVMVADPDTIRSGLIPLVFLAALAGACWAIGSRLRRDAAAEAERDGWDE